MEFAASRGSLFFAMGLRSKEEKTLSHSCRIVQVQCVGRRSSPSSLPRSRFSPKPVKRRTDDCRSQRARCLLSGNCRCYTANPFAALESPLLYGKIVSCTGIVSAAQQIPLLHWNRRCCAAKSFPVRELPLLHRKFISSPGIDAAALQNRFLCRKCRC